MGITYVEGTVSSASGQSETLQFLVDSGASYSLLPPEVWQKLGLNTKRTEEFALADGTIVQRGISECHIAIGNAEGHTPVVLGEPGDDQALSGVVTLENLGLVFDPFRRELRSMKLRL